MKNVVCNRREIFVTTPHLLLSPLLLSFITSPSPPSYRITEFLHRKIINSIIYDTALPSRDGYSEKKKKKNSIF